MLQMRAGLYFLDNDFEKEQLISSHTEIFPYHLASV
jgi:hypothetical protein